jgi:hydantoinase/carbamoylase family amidase
MRSKRGAASTKPAAKKGRALRYGPALMARLDELAAFTEVDGQLTRRYLSRAHVEAIGHVKSWMTGAGMSVRTDPLLSLYGRYEGRSPGAPAIMLGSHLDTVIDAGRYDGALGVIAAISAVEELNRQGERLEHAVEVAAFGEEEGSRFPAHILTSSALVGAVKPATLDLEDADGISVREALRLAGGDAEAYRACRRAKGELAAYLELHIEQGPVLASKGLALAAVTAINGSTRSLVTVEGFAGHAGTVPMNARRDALVSASEMMLAVEQVGRAQEDLVVTVGRIKALPGAPNVIPGRVEFTIDLRGPADAQRKRAHAALLRRLKEIARARRVSVDIDTYQENPAVTLDKRVIEAAADAIAACSAEPLRLSSGAGHDAGIMAKHCPSGMIFLRCKDGVSHNPAESITAEDADLGVLALLETVRLLDARLGQSAAGSR